MPDPSGLGAPNPTINLRRLLFSNYVYKQRERFLLHDRNAQKEIQNASTLKTFLNTEMKIK